MSDASQREWHFSIDDMIDFAEKVLACTEGFDHENNRKRKPHHTDTDLNAQE